MHDPNELERHSLAEWREIKGREWGSGRAITQQQLAEAVGAHTSTISRIEQTGKVTHGDIMLAIAEVLGVDIRQILEFDRPRRPKPSPIQPLSDTTDSDDAEEDEGDEPTGHQRGERPKAMARYAA